LSSAQQAQEQIQHDSDDSDVKDLDQAEVADYIAQLPEELAHRSVPNKEAINAICA
jgi:hypothetical protein